LAGVGGEEGKWKAISRNSKDAFTKKKKKEKKAKWRGLAAQEFAIERVYGDDEKSYHRKIFRTSGVQDERSSLQGGKKAEQWAWPVCGRS